MNKRHRQKSGDLLILSDCQEFQQNYSVDYDEIFFLWQSSSPSRLNQASRSWNICFEYMASLRMKQNPVCINRLIVL